MKSPFPSPTNHCKSSWNLRSCRHVRRNAASRAATRIHYNSASTDEPHRRRTGSVQSVAQHQHLWYVSFVDLVCANRHSIQLKNQLKTIFTSMGAPNAIWRNVIETAALRQDALIFGKLSVALCGRTALHDGGHVTSFAQVQHTYWIRLFYNVTFNLTCRPARTYVEYTRNGKCHCVGNPAVEWSDGAIEWWLNGERFNVNGVAAQTRTSAYYWDGMSLLCAPMPYVIRLRVAH